MSNESLSQRISQTIATDAYHRTMALINAGPRIRAAEYLETRLQEAGLRAKAVGNINLHNGCHITTHVVCEAAERDVATAMLAHDIAFDRTTVRGQTAVHYDCNIDTYNVSLLVMPLAPEAVRLQEAA